MRKVLFQASRTIKAATDTEKAVKEKVSKEVEVPLTFAELQEMDLNNPFGAEKIEGTIGYSVDGNRIKMKLDWRVMLFLEGYKLYVGKEIAPEAEEEQDEELNDALAKLPEQKLLWVEEMLSYSTGKKKKALRERIIAGKFN